MTGALSGSAIEHDLHRPGRARIVALVAVVVLALVACAPAAPRGPAFLAAPEPAPERARVYVYRFDPVSSRSTVALSLDGRRSGPLHDREYLTFLVDPGAHRVDFRQHGLGFSSFGWNGKDFRVGAGETVYFEVSVRILSREIPGSGRDLEIAGRASGSASENVFIQPRGRETALRHLAETTQRVE